MEPKHELLVDRMTAWIGASGNFLTERSNNYISAGGAIFSE